MQVGKYPIDEAEFKYFELSRLRLTNDINAWYRRLPEDQQEDYLSFLKVFFFEDFGPLQTPMWVWDTGLFYQQGRRFLCRNLPARIGLLAIFKPKVYSATGLKYIDEVEKSSERGAEHEKWNLRLFCSRVITLNSRLFSNFRVQRGPGGELLADNRQFSFNADNIIHFHSEADLEPHILSSGQTLYIPTKETYQWDCFFFNGARLAFFSFSISDFQEGSQNKSHHEKMMATLQGGSSLCTKILSQLSPDLPDTQIYFDETTGKLMTPLGVEVLLFYVCGEFLTTISLPKEELALEKYVHLVTREDMTNYGVRFSRDEVSAKALAEKRRALIKTKN